MATRKISNSAKTGKFVSKEYAKKHPSTTETITVKTTQKKKAPKR